MQKSLFNTDYAVQLPLADGHLTLYPDWLTETEEAELFRLLRHSIVWEQSKLRIHGRVIPIPRLNAWYGDPGCDYQYSGYQLPLNPWTAELAALRLRLQQQLQAPFNSVLANCYRDGNDSVAWHSDDEPELGPDPLIASVSLGVSRRFSLRHRYCSKQAPMHIDLTPGSLLVMSGSTQRFWRHSLPKSRRIVEARINLTFRYIVSRGR